MSEHADPSTWAAISAAIGTGVGAALSAVGVRKYQQLKPSGVDERLETLTMAVNQNANRLTALETERLHSAQEWDENRKVLLRIFSELKDLNDRVIRLTTIAERER